MKQRLAILLLTLSLGLTGCTSATPAQSAPPIEGFLLKEAVRMTVSMDVIAASGSYLESMTSLPELLAVADDIAAQDYQTPREAYLIELPSETFFAALSEFGNVTIPEDIKEALRYRLGGSTIAPLLNGQEGTTMLATTSMLTLSHGYVQPSNWRDNCLVLLEYDGGYGSLVSFSAIGEGVVGSTAMFVKSGQSQLLSAMETMPDLLPQLIYHVYSGEELSALLR